VCTLWGYCHAGPTARRAPGQARPDCGDPARARGAQREETLGWTRNPGPAPNPEAGACGRGRGPANRGARGVLLGDKAM